MGAVEVTLIAFIAVMTVLAGSSVIALRQARRGRNSAEDAEPALETAERAHR